MITLIEKDKFEYQGQGTAVSWTPMGFGPWSIPATLALHDGRTITMELLMDLGYNDQILIATGGEHNITFPGKDLPALYSSNIAGVRTAEYQGRINQVSIGGYSVNNIICGFVAKEQADQTVHEAMIGLGVLSRFNIVFDYSRRRIFFEPNKSFGDAYEHNMSGISMRDGQGDYLEVAKVLANSPAGEADLKVGDRVTHINGQAAKSYDRDERSHLMVQEGETIKLKVTRDGQEQEIAFVLRRLI